MGWKKFEPHRRRDGDKQTKSSSTLQQGTTKPKRRTNPNRRRIMKRDLARAIRQRNIEEICWLLLKEELKLVDKGEEPKLGKSTFMKIIDKVASFEQLRARAAINGETDIVRAETRATMNGKKNLDELVKWANA